MSYLDSALYVFLIGMPIRKTKCLAWPKFKCSHVLKEVGMYVFTDICSGSLAGASDQCSSLLFIPGDSLSNVDCQDLSSSNGEGTACSISLDPHSGLFILSRDIESKVVSSDNHPGNNSTILLMCLHARFSSRKSLFPLVISTFYRVELNMEIS